MRTRFGLATAFIVLLCVACAAQCDVEAVFLSQHGRDAIGQRLIAEIDAAADQLLIALYACTDLDLISAVLRAHQRGVDVYVLVDEGPAEWDARQELSPLVDEGVHLAVVSEDAAVQHRFVIIDRETVITGSYDWVGPANALDMDNVVIIECPEIAGQFVAEFTSIANDILGLGWIGLSPLSSGVVDRCQECLARLNQSTRGDFGGCPGVDESLALLLEAYRPYVLGTCSQSGIETLLLGVPGMPYELIAVIGACICGDILQWSPSPPPCGCSPD